MIDEGADDVWIAKVHTQPHARVLQRPAIVVRHVDRIAQKGLIDRSTRPVPQLEMELVYVEIMQFGRAVLDDPIFDVALLDDDIRDLRLRIERLSFLTIDREIKRGRTIGVVRILRLLGEV